MHAIEERWWVTECQIFIRPDKRQLIEDTGRNFSCSVLRVLRSRCLADYCLWGCSPFKHDDTKGLKEWSSGWSASVKKGVADPSHKLQLSLKSFLGCLDLPPCIDSIHLVLGLFLLPYPRMRKKTGYHLGLDCRFPPSFWFTCVELVTVAKKTSGDA